jgi:hypothetical protein
LESFEEGPWHGREDNIGMDLWEIGLWVWTGFILIRIGNGARLLKTL